MAMSRLTWRSTGTRPLVLSQASRRLVVLWFQSDSAKGGSGYLER
jgi:hypothetical protein